MPETPAIEIRQIFYDDATRAAVRPGFLPLDNSDAPPGWFEFWPILRFLRETELRDDVWYGFVSPRFPDKARVSVDEVLDLLRSNPDAEVALVSSVWQELGMFLNPWVQGEVHHPGLVACSEAFFRAIGEPVDLRREIATFDTAVFSNYVIAKRPFWEAWRDLAEKYLAYVEAGGPDLPDNRETAYSDLDPLPMRVFVQERFACRLLMTRRFHTCRLDYARMTARGPGGRRFPWAMGRLYALSDGAKALARQTGLRAFLLPHRIAAHALLRITWRLDLVRGAEPTGQPRAAEGSGAPGGG